MTIYTHSDIEVTGTPDSCPTGLMVREGLSSKGHREVPGVLSPDSVVQPHLSLKKVIKITFISKVTELLGPALPVLVLDLTDLRFPK